LDPGYIKQGGHTWYSFSEKATEIMKKYLSDIPIEYKFHKTEIADDRLQVKSEDVLDIITYVTNEEDLDKLLRTGEDG
jgi:hypothetical protein